MTFSNSLDPDPDPNRFDTEEIFEKLILKKKSEYVKFWGRLPSMQRVIGNYTSPTLTNFSMKYLVMLKVYTDVGGVE